jgi:alpha-L-fucosidase
MGTKFFAAAFAAVAAAGPLFGDDAPPKSIFNETPERRAERISWWRHDRFGMFIHFGLYAMPARHEWVRSKEHIPNETYDKKYFPRFNPDLFDAREWARAAKKAGMKYMVLTTKHHEGFCMWDTATTDYKITKTAFGRDVVREFADAFRAEGIKVGFYFSIMDWHHPDYTVDHPHPLFRKITGDKKDAVEKLNANRNMDRYRKYMFDQVRELLTGYGRIDILWYD